MNDLVYQYLDNNGNPINYIPEIVNQQVTELCYLYIEKNKGKRPTYMQIYKMVDDCINAMLLEGSEG